MTIDTVTPAPVRASNAEREAAEARLHDALGHGRLDLAETEERVAAAYAAQYRTDLLPLLADLPHGSSPTGSDAPTWTELWTSVAWRARIAVLGSAAANAAPTPRQSRTVAVLAVIAVLWLVLWAFVGAAVVG